MTKRRALRGIELTRFRWRVFERDGFQCVALRLDPAHRCGGPFGPIQPSQPGYTHCLTLEHVTKFSALGVRADDIEEECLTLCALANVHGWASAHRHEERLYLAERYPEHWADVPEVQP